MTTHACDSWNPFRAVIALFAYRSRRRKIRCGEIPRKWRNVCKIRSNLFPFDLPLETHTFRMVNRFRAKGPISLCEGDICTYSGQVLLSLAQEDAHT